MQVQVIGVVGKAEGKIAGRSAVRRIGLGRFALQRRGIRCGGCGGGGWLGGGAGRDDVPKSCGEGSEGGRFAFISFHSLNALHRDGRGGCMTRKRINEARTAIRPETLAHRGGPVGTNRSGWTLVWVRKDGAREQYDSRLACLSKRKHGARLGRSMKGRRRALSEPVAHGGSAERIEGGDGRTISR